jgi:hypothetical protein
VRCQEDAEKAGATQAERLQSLEADASGAIATIDELRDKADQLKVNATTYVEIQL